MLPAVCQLAELCLIAIPSVGAVFCPKTLQLQQPATVMHQINRASVPLPREVEKVLRLRKARFLDRDHLIATRYRPLSPFFSGTTCTMLHTLAKALKVVRRNKRVPGVARLFDPLQKCGHRDKGEKGESAWRNPLQSAFYDCAAWVPERSIEGVGVN